MEESPSLTGHAANHIVYSHNYTAAKRLRLEQIETPCTLLRDKCYELAVEQENWYLTKLHLDTAPQRVNTPIGSEGITALMQFGHISIRAQYLLKLGADVNAQDRLGDSVLMRLVKHKHVEPKLIEIILTAGANVDVMDKNGIHIIEHAAKKFYVDIEVHLLEMLLASGQVSVLDHTNAMNLVLLSAVQNTKHDNVAIVKLLTKGGIDVNVVNEHFSDSVLMCAVQNPRISFCVVKLLIEACADVNTLQKCDKYSALMFAVENQNSRVVKLLIQSGADVNHRNAGGKTVLMLANEETIVKMLVDAGADVNAKDENENSVLMLNIIHNKQINQSLVMNLTEKGANLIEKKS
jgi:ankyrin repeat protein